MLQKKVLPRGSYTYYWSLLIALLVVLSCVTIIARRHTKTVFVDCDEDSSSITLDQTMNIVSDVRIGRDDDNVEVSYHPDIVTRGKWQENQIDKFCEAHGFGNLAYSLDIVEPLKREFYRHMIMDNETENLYCFLPKVGCRTTRTVILVSKGKVPKEAIRVDINKPPTENVLQQGIMKSSFLTETLTDESRINALKTYGKYIIIRHPLQRILSGYLDKISKYSLIRNFPDNPEFEMQPLMHKIVKTYHPQEYSLWMENVTGNSSELIVTFDDYLAWLSDMTNEELSLLNEHFSPQYHNSQPCRVRYHFYGNFDNFKEDFTSILEQFKINDSSVIMSLPSVIKGASLEKIDEFWPSVPIALRKRFYQSYKVDFDFYHALYPKESSLTKKYFQL